MVVCGVFGVCGGVWKEVYKLCIVRINLAATKMCDCVKSCVARSGGEIFRGVPL